MSQFLTFLAGTLFMAGALWIKPRTQSKKTWLKVINWALYVGWYAITWVGISFIYINASVGHVKATSTAIFLFLGLSILLGVIEARLLGFIGLGKAGLNKSIET